MKPSARESLLAAAQKLFSAKGYEAVSTRELAEEAGVNLAAIQYHFGSKAELFVATIHHMMEGSACLRPHLIKPGEVKSRAEAAKRLCEFIQTYLAYMLKPQGSPGCKLMFRELLSDNAHGQELFGTLISSFVENYSKPLEASLIALISLIEPALNPEELRRSAQSVIGQCSVNVTHRPFIERIWEDSFDNEKFFNETARHIAQFSLRGLRCSDKFVDDAVNEVFK